MINITTKNFDAMLKRLDEAEQKIMTAAVQANIAVAAKAEKLLKDTLSFQAGKDPHDKNYRNSPKGSLPYGHSMRLRNSIGFKVFRIGNGIKAEVGSGIRKKKQIEYAEYLEGRNGNGIRPFLWAASGIFNADTIIEKFRKFYGRLK